MNTDWTDSLAALRATLPGADEPADDGQTAEEASDTSATGNRQLTLCYERKQRRGKPATIITGFDCSDEQLSEIASKIKKRLATGGSAAAERYSCRATAAKNSARCSPTWATR